MKNILSIIAVIIIFYSCKNNNNNSVSAQKITEANASFHFTPLSKQEQAHYRAVIEKKYQQLFPNNATNFSGQILIAKNGTVLFEKYVGLQDFYKHAPMTENSSLHLASISKTFTAVAVLRLYEQGRIKLEDIVQKYFPSFPYKDITIQQLLSHRSGLPNYLYVMDKNWDKKKLASNQDIIDFLTINKPPIAAYPNRRFQYCNTNYILLASIVEKITRQSFPDYMRDSIFLPLDMKDTYVFSKKDSAKYIPTFSASRPYPMDPYDGSYGDKNVFSTVRDLLKWDKSFYSHALLKPETIALSYEPQSVEKASTHNYGLGWRMINNNNNSKIIYHNGKWHGTNSVFVRMIQDSAVIILIGNKENRNIYRGKEFMSIFSQKYDSLHTKD